MHNLRRCFYLWVLTLSLSTMASVVTPDDGPYYRLRQDRTLYIYDATSRDFVEQLASYNQAIRTMYDQSFGWKLDEEMDLILTSPHQQVANAYATVSPNIKAVWYPSGVAVADEMATTSWLRLLNAHEVAHLYQLNAKGSFNSTLKSIFGNAAFLVFPLAPVVPIFIHPNFLTPTFLIEGNATFNESRLNAGGRLHSGEKRALVLSQIAAGDIDPTRLINEDFNFPFGEEPYLQGAYFQAHLAAKYGVEKTNQFFVEQGKHYFWPLILNKTFRDHFGNSYPQEVREYVRGLEGLAKKQKNTESEALLTTTFVGELNHDDHRVFFLTTDSKEPTLLRVFDKSTRRFETRQLDLVFDESYHSGKVFFEGSTVRTAGYRMHDLHHIEYSLYGENASFDPRYRGQIVCDQRAGKTASLDAANSWQDFKLLVNGEPYDISHSHPILDPQGRVYYFRQNGLQRVLYRNREPLTKFDGFYGKPTEVTPDGTFYFIASTDYGSSLYRWRGREISRVLASDRVIDARWIGGEDFLVVEVGHLGHEIKIAHAEPRAQLPAVYNYGFASTNVVPEKVPPAPDLARKERSYNSLGQLRYSALEAQTGYSSGSGASVLASASFVDPLEYQSVTAAYAGTQFNDRAALLQYSFTKYLPNFFARYFYEEDEWLTIDRRDQLAYNQEVSLGMSLPIWRWRRWDAGVGAELLYKNDDAHNDPLDAIPRADREETYGTRVGAGLSYTLAPGLGFYPWRGFTLNYLNRLESLPGGFTKRDNTSLVQTQYTHGFHQEFYATLAANYAWAETPDIKVGYEDAVLSQDIRLPRLTSHNEEYLTKNAGSVRLEVTNVQTVRGYSARIPFGINRIAPLLVGQAIFMDDDPHNVYPQNTFEWGWGADFEILFLHRIPLHLRLLNAYDTRSPVDVEGDKEAKLSYKLNF